MFGEIHSAFKMVIIYLFLELNKNSKTKAARRSLARAFRKTICSVLWRMGCGQGLADRLGPRIHFRMRNFDYESWFRV